MTQNVTHLVLLIFRPPPPVERRRRWESGADVTEYGVVLSFGGGRGMEETINYLLPYHWANGP